MDKFIEEKKSLIKGYITEEECNYDCDDEIFDCESCSNFKECCMKAEIRCNVEFAESMDYGGYDTPEDFWEQI
jgi:hypothetical protein